MLCSVLRPSGIQRLWPTGERPVEGQTSLSWRTWPLRRRWENGLVRSGKWQPQYNLSVPERRWARRWNRLFQKYIVGRLIDEHKLKHEFYLEYKENFLILRTAMLQKSLPKGLAISVRQGFQNPTRQNAEQLGLTCCFEQEAEIQISWNPFQPELFFYSNYPVNWSYWMAFPAICVLLSE